MILKIWSLCFDVIVIAPKLSVAFNYYQHDHTLEQARSINSYLGKIEFK